MERGKKTKNDNENKNYEERVNDDITDEEDYDVYKYCLISV